MNTSLPRVSWFLERQGHLTTRYHLDVLLKTRDHITIGRKAGGAVDIICQGKTVSRSHCVLTVKDDVWHVEDLGSMNGVFLNGTLIPSAQPVPLAVGDSLGIGCKDTSESDYHVFTVCKAVVKDENENALKSTPLRETGTPKPSVPVLSAVLEPPPLQPDECIKLSSRDEIIDQLSNSLVSAPQSFLSENLSKNYPVNYSIEESTERRQTPGEKDERRSSNVPKVVLNNVRTSDHEVNASFEAANPRDISENRPEQTPSSMKNNLPVPTKSIRGSEEPLVDNSSSRGIASNLESSNQHDVLQTPESTNLRTLDSRVSSGGNEPKSLSAKTSKETMLLKSSKKCDEKLRLKCVVVLKRLTDKQIKKHARSKPNSTARRSKTRVRRLVLSDDDEDSEHKPQEGGDKKEFYAAKQAKKLPAKKCSRNIQAGGLPEREASPSCIATGAHSESQPSSSKSIFVVQKLPLPSVETIVRSPNSYTPAFDGSSDSDDDIFAPISNLPNPKEEEDDECITIYSDEEFIPSTPRIKHEKADTPDAQEVHVVEEILLDSDESNQGALSDEEFFPMLSQPFLDEIAAEEAAEASTSSGCIETNLTGDKISTESATDKLETILAKHKVKENEKCTKLTEPRQLDVSRRHTNKRFTLATARSKKPKETGKSSFIDKLRKDQDLASYSRCVKTANSKNANAPVFPPPEQSSKKTDPTKHTENISKKISVSKEKSKGSVPVKAKVTKRSRGDLLTAEMVPEGAVKRPSEEAGTGLSSFTIPKKPRVEATLSAEPLANEKMNGEYDPLDQIDLDVDLTALGPLQPSTFKAIPKRIAHLPNDDERVKSMPKPRPDPCQSQLPASKRSRTFQPRSSAIPLGDQRRRNSIPPPLTPEEWRKSRGLVASKLKEPVSSSGNSSEANEYVNEQSSTDVVPSVISGSTSNPKSGILVHPGQINNRKSTGKRLSITFGEDQIRYIESKEEVAAAMREEEKANVIISSDKNTSDACTPLVPINASIPVQQVARKPATGQDPRANRDYRTRLPSIVESMLARVCNWNYSWIAEQENLDEPPPVLSAVKCKASTLPELTPIPVLMAYNSIAQYQDVFFPLMLHEIWGHICKDVENTESVWRAKAILRENVSSDGVSAFVQCEALVPEASPGLWEYDLVVVSFAVKKKQIREVFGVVEGVSLRNYDGSKEIDKRLHLSCPKPCVRVNFTLRMKPSNVPKDHSQLLVKIRRITTLKTQVKQLSMVSELPNSPLYDVIMDPIRNSEAFTLIEEASEISCMSQLNEIQQKAVMSISETVLKTEKDVPKVAMLQGPPGTGKSHVIVQLVLRLLSQHYAEKKKMPRILICAPSNNATDEIALRLVNTVNFKKKRLMVVRVGVPSAINPNLKEIAVETLAKAEHKRLVANRTSDVTPRIEMVEKELENLDRIKQGHYSTLSNANKSHDQDNAKLVARKLQDVEERIEAMKKSKLQFEEEHALRFHNELWRAKEAIIGQANVICTTLNSCRNKDMENVFLRSKDGNQNPEILCCIIDEASQCTEPESLTPLGLGISKLILIGDPDQLPATVCSQYAQRLRFDQSLFNRFFSARTSADPTNNNSVMMLNTQYRMVSTICTWPSKYFYGNKLITDPNIVRNGPGALAGIICNYKVLNVYDGEEIIDTSDGNARSIMNRKEAKVVVGIIQALGVIEPNIHKHVGVITFYQRQKNCIIETLRKSGINLKGDVEVNTVDGFQGQEKDIVIVSCVRANRDVGFLGSLQRMNVALTRARHSLIVVGHFDTLYKNEAWRDLITDAKNRNHCNVITSDFVLENFENLILKKTA